MNLLFVNSTHHWAGIKTWMAHLAEFLHHQGHQVLVACRPEDPLRKACEQRGVSCWPIHFGPDYNPIAIAHFMRHLKQHQVELVITNVAKDRRTAGVAAKLMGALHVNRLGLQGDLKLNWRNRLEYRWGVDEVLVPSRSLKTSFQETLNLHGRVRSFPNVVRSVQKALPQNQVPQLATVAYLSRRKQVHVMLDVLASLRSLPWHFHIGGTGEERDALEQQATQLGLASRVTFHGFVSPYEFLVGKDIGLLYSTDEGMPNTLLEYMASGNAVISSDLPGVREVFQEQPVGLIVDPHQPDSLKQALTRLLQSAEERQQLARNALLLVQNHHEMPRVFHKIETHFEALIAQRGRAYAYRPI